MADLFDNAVLDRHARMAAGQPVDSELELAERLAFLTSVPGQNVRLDSPLADTFIARKRIWARAGKADDSRA